MFCAQFERKYGKEDFTFSALENEREYFISIENGWPLFCLDYGNDDEDRKKTHSGEKFR